MTSAKSAKLINRPILWLLRFYSAYLSPLKPGVCRFSPTCSHYAAGCFSRFGFFLASWLTLKRLARCQPFCEGGHDPVPGDPSDASF